jgi:glycine/D-amino acid oxidase-like deaminating enzyme
VRLRIAIIGGGIGSLAAALALERRGGDVILAEQSAALSEIGAGTQNFDRNRPVFHNHSRRESDVFHQQRRDQETVDRVTDNAHTGRNRHYEESDDQPGGEGVYRRDARNGQAILPSNLAVLFNVGEWSTASFAQGSISVRFRADVDMDRQANPDGPVDNDPKAPSAIKNPGESGRR